MKASNPPALATWLVEHLDPEGRNEALTGDLLEQFSQGRSSAWYWRQVLVAIFVGVVKEWRILVLAITVTAGWAYPFYYGRLWLGSLTVPSFHLGARALLIASLIYSTAAFTSLSIGPISFACAIYFAMTVTKARQRGPRRFLLGLLKGYLVAAFTAFVLLEFLPARHHPESVGNTMGLVPTFLGMLIALWALRPFNASDGTPKFFRLDPPSSW